MDLEKQLLVQDLSFENKKKKKKLSSYIFFFEKQTHTEKRKMNFYFFIFIMVKNLLFPFVERKPIQYTSPYSKQVPFLLPPFGYDTSQVSGLCAPY